MRLVTPKIDAQQTHSVLRRMRESLVHVRKKPPIKCTVSCWNLVLALSKGLAIMKLLSSILVEHELPVRLTIFLQRLHDQIVYLDE